MLKWSSAKHPSIILLQILSDGVTWGKNQIKQGSILCPFRGLSYKKSLGTNVLKALLWRGGETM